MMSFSEELESLLSDYRDEYRQIVNGWIESGTFGITYPAFLVETYHYVKHSCPLMIHACDLLDVKHHELRTYITRHIAEETGHEEWVLSDLEQLGVDKSTVIASYPLPETINLIGSQLYVIDYLHPAGMLGYVYMMESTPPSEESLNYLQDVVGIPPNAMSFLIKHGKLDIEHKRELKQMIDTQFVRADERNAVMTSAIMGLSNVNHLLSRIRSGDFVNDLPQLIDASGSRQTKN